jgi:hypothetical protein
MRKILALFALIALMLVSPGTTTAAIAKPKPPPPLDIQIVKITKHEVVVRTVCPNDPPARIYVYTTSPSRQLASTEPVTCLRTKYQRFVIPLSPGVTLRKGEHLGQTWVTFSGDSGEMNNVWQDVVVGERLERGDLF